MWAPAVGTEEGQGNWTEVKPKPFSEINDLLQVKYGSDFISAQECSIGIVHGTADDVVSVSNSEQIFILSRRQKQLQKI